MSVTALASQIRVAYLVRRAHNIELLRERGSVFQKNPSPPTGRKGGFRVALFSVIVVLPYTCSFLPKLGAVEFAAPPFFVYPVRTLTGPEWI